MKTKKILFYSSGRADRNMLESIMKECKKYFECYLTDNGYVADTITKDIDYLFILGDRWNLIPIVTEAIKNNVPIIHQGGGEVSLGSYDETFRRMISQAAKYHFVINENCKANLKERGIIENVFVCGSPRMDYLNYTKPNESTIKDTFIILYHPATNSKENPVELFNALKHFNRKMIFINPGDDIGKEKVMTALHINSNEINHDDWIELLNSSCVMIGNSSAGISEAPSYKLPFVNIGHRQDGREKLENVIDCECKCDEIIEAIKKALSQDFKKSITGMVNTFSDRKASYRIAETLKTELLKGFNKPIIRV